MKTSTLKTLVIAVTFAATSLLYTEAFSQTIAVVDMQKILDSASAANTVRDEVKQLHEKFVGEIKKKEDELKKEDAELQKQHAILSAEAFDVKLKKFKEKHLAVERDVQGKRNTLDKALSDSLKILNDHVQKIITAMAQEKKYDIVIYKLQVSYVKPDYDLTDQVLAKLNKELPKLDIKTNTNTKK